MKRRPDLAAMIVASVLLGAVATVNADTINFDYADDFSTPLVNGQDLETNSPFGTLFNLSSYGDNQGAAIFDTTAGVNGADPDLWVGMGNALILQSNDSPNKTGGNRYSTPNDSASGGYLCFDFLVNGLTVDSIDVIDVDAGGRMKIWLFDSDNKVRVVNVPSHFTGDVHQGDVGFATIDLSGGVTYSPEISWLSTWVWTDYGFNENDIARMKIRMWGSGAVDNLRYSVVPLPAAAWLGLSGLAGIAAVRRRGSR